MSEMAEHDHAPVLAVDPGKVTGLALWRPGDPEPELSELEFDEACDLVEAFAREYPCSDATIVAERFTITTRTGQLSQAPWSLEVIGVCRRESRKRLGRDLVLQAPASAKGMATNSRLKHLGWWHAGGAGHANDAARHLLLFAATRGMINASALVGV